MSLSPGLWLAGRGRGRGREEGEGMSDTDPVVPRLSQPQPSASPSFPRRTAPHLLPDGQKITQGHKRPAVMTPCHTDFCVFNAVCAQMKKKERKKKYSLSVLSWPVVFTPVCVCKKTHKLCIAQKTEMNYSPYKFVSTGFFFITPPACLTSQHGTNRHCASRSAL